MDVEGTKERKKKVYQSNAEAIVKNLVFLFHADHAKRY